MSLNRKQNLTEIKNLCKEIIEEIQTRYKNKNKTIIVGADINVNFLFYGLLGFPRAEKYSDADIVVFTGGADINPNLYGEKPHASVNRINRQRDTKEFLLYKSLKDSVLKLGICRGGQFLNVMNGGKLWQNVDRHTNDHYLINIDDGEITQVTSTHHQQMIPNYSSWNFNPVAIACDIKGNPFTLCSRKEKEKFAHVNIRSNSNHKTNLNTVWDAQDYYKVDFEAIYYQDTNSFCFQPHPEYLNYEIGKSTCKYFLKQLIELTKENPFAPSKIKVTDVPDFLKTAQQ